MQKGMIMTKVLLVLVTAVLFGGCAGQDFRKPGATGYEWNGSMLDGAPNLKSEPGRFVTVRCPAVVRDGQWVEFKCTPATVHAEPPGHEAYSYVFKLKIRSLAGIPYGEEAITAYVIGDRDHCQKKSAEHNVRLDGRVNEGNLRLSADPTERCAGPFYIRNDDAKASR
jgi:hypothetical protein